MKQPHQKEEQRLSYLFTLVSVVLLLSILTGLGGIFLHQILELVENLTFGAKENSTPFVAAKASPFHRGSVLIGIGIVSALIWYFLQKKIAILSIKDELTAPFKQLCSLDHLFRQFLHIIWQIVSVGAGAPVGKEAAPRELGALIASPLAFWFSIQPKDRRFLIACGAGAGLAAVYQVPFTSIFFVFETLKLKRSLRNICLVATSIYYSAYIARFAISVTPLYHVPHVHWVWMDVPLLFIAVFVLSPFAWLFLRCKTWVSRHRIKDKKIFWSLPLAFLLLAFLSSSWPYLLGNGRMMAQAVFDGISLYTAGQLFLLKAFLVLLILGAGAYGGVLTPSFALGATGALIFTRLFPNVIGGSVSSFLLLGAVTFLAITLNAPLSAVGLVVGFTGQPIFALAYLLPAAYLAWFYAKFIEKISEEVSKRRPLSILPKINPKKKSSVQKDEQNKK